MDDEEVPQLRAPAPAAPISSQPQQLRPGTNQDHENKPVVFPGENFQTTIFRPQKFSTPFYPTSVYPSNSFVPVSGPVFVPQRPVLLPTRIPLVQQQQVGPPAVIHSTSPLPANNFHEESNAYIPQPTPVPVRPLRPPTLVQGSYPGFQESDNRQPFGPLPGSLLPYPITQNPTTVPHYVVPRPQKYTPVAIPEVVTPYSVKDFQFGYDVDFTDKYGGARYSHNENHNGKAITGKYNVNLPGGSFQSVSYTSQH